MAAREAYSLYVERAAEGANEADGPLSAPCYSQRRTRRRYSSYAIPNVAPM